MDSAVYWAHSAPVAQRDPSSRDGWQRLAVHLEAVGKLTRELARAARPDDGNFADVAEIVGLLHDFGKYSDCFQRMLETGRGRCQHAIHGAMLAFFGAAGAAREHGLAAAALAVAGHHGGLANATDLADKLREAKYRTEAAAILARAVHDCEGLNQIIPYRLAEQDGVSPRKQGARLDLAVRMLFSCLVDADRLDSAGRGAKTVGHNQNPLSVIDSSF